VALLAGWILACLVGAWLTRRHTAVACGLVVVVWLSIPSVAGQRLTGINTLHPASLLCVVVFGVQLIARSDRLAHVLILHRYTVLVASVFVVGTLLTSGLMGRSGARLLLDVIVIPFLLFLLVATLRSARELEILRNIVLAAVAVEVVYVLIQQQLGSMILFAKDYEKLRWFKPETFDRWMGTTDSPLALALIVSCTAPLTFGLRSSLVRIPLLMLDLLACLITQTRSGVALMAVIIVYSVFRAKTAVWIRILSTIALAVGLYLVATSSFIGATAERFTDDSGSIDARRRALDFMAENIGQFVLLGQGMRASYEVARLGGLQTSLESSYLMYVVDSGAVLATLYFGMQVALVVGYGHQRLVRGATLAAGVALISQHVSSSVGYTNASGTFIWLVLGLMVAAADAPPPCGVSLVTGGRFTVAERTGFAAGRSQRTRAAASALTSSRV